jgi:hypothetical protein
VQDGMWAAFHAAIGLRFHSGPALPEILTAEICCQTERLCIVAANDYDTI